MVIPLRMGWRNMLFQHWGVDPGSVDALVPEALELDLHDGLAWISIIPFSNVAVRPAALPARLGVSLPELNVRTYVRYEDTPAIYFFSLDAAGFASVLGARVFHRLPYFFATISIERHDEEVHFRGRRRHPGARAATFVGGYRPNGPTHLAKDHPRDRFLLERYRFYTESQTGQIRYTDVEHESWTVAPATVEIVQNTYLEATGIADPERGPIHQYSQGVDVRVSPSRRTSPAER